MLSVALGMRYTCSSCPVGIMNILMFFSELRKHVRSTQALLGSWRCFGKPRMTTLVCTIALSPPIFEGSMFNS